MYSGEDFMQMQTDQNYTFFLFYKNKIKKRRAREGNKLCSINAKPGLIAGD